MLKEGACEAEYRRAPGDIAVCVALQGSGSAEDIVSVPAYAVLRTGSPALVAKDGGDQHLSVSLQVAEHKLALGHQACEGVTWCGTAAAAAEGNKALIQSLDRYFKVKEDEWQVWGDLGEMRQRVETMGHSLALRLAAGARAVAAANHGVETHHLPRIAMIVPATSKGVTGLSGAGGANFNEADLPGLPLYTALLSSLYNTCESDFR